MTLLSALSLRWRKTKLLVSGLLPETDREAVLDFGSGEALQVSDVVFLDLLGVSDLVTSSYMLWLGHQHQQQSALCILALYRLG
jgi:hypothetical protein